MANEGKATFSGTTRSPALHFSPYDELAGAPNVIVDGSPTEGTVLCLTHWPGIASPPQFRADLSAEMAFLYADAFDRHDPATAVSNNHFDQDGLVSLHALVHPEAARELEGLLVDVARAGDFGTFCTREAARLSMILSAYATPERSPLAGLDPAEYPTMTARLYTELLDRLPDLINHPDRYGELWEEEDATLTASEAAIHSGTVTIEERPDVDLAVITVPDGAPTSGGHRFAGTWVDGLHPMAINNATERGALLVLRGQHCTFTYRYESWVQYRSRSIRPRVHLAPLAEQLNAEESADGTWVAQPVSALAPTLALHRADASGLPPARIQSLVEAHLRHSPPAWDPYEISRAVTAPHQ